MTTGNNTIKDIRKKACKCGEKKVMVTMDNHPKTGIKMVTTVCIACKDQSIKYG